MDFQIIDYVTLCLTFLLSIGIGLYYAIFKKQNTPEEYLHGGKTLNPYAVAFSIVSGILSGIVMTSLPTDIYYFGSQYGFLQTPTTLIIYSISYFWVIPVFHKLQVTSIYHYFELRFNSKVRKLSSFMFTFQVVLQMPLVLFVTVLVVAQVSRVNLSHVTLIICFICTTYTIFGGIKAVVWTDALQFCVMFGAMITVLIIGTISVGGIENLFRIPYENGRIKFDFDYDMTKRDTVWGVMLGLTFQSLSLSGIAQGTIQKMLSLKNFSDIKSAYLFTAISWILLLTIATLNGIMLVARYVMCDPLTTKQISKPDQLMSYAILNMSTTLPGLLGVFVAGIVSAGLSTLSANLNSLSATIFNDFLRNCLPQSIIRKHEMLILKLIVLLAGVTCTVLTYAVEHLGNILPLLVNLLALTGSPIVGLFFAGLFFPSVNSKGALIGGISSFLILAWLIISTFWYKINNRVEYPTLPIFTTSCNVSEIANISISSTNKIFNNDPTVPIMYQISHYYYHPIGAISVVVIGVLISFITKKKNHYVKDDYLSPLVLYFRKKISYSKYKSVELRDINS
ncbi:sodium-coupled monocarboxylate transporter 2-like [Onthophagus taurus]|uniref:sodium-coupled monocarboxylate transporter 2-like n=1 Tax=Onthophagus taurus TaxID=166361 RepID=UPI000C20BAA9|nr:sodium-coupled monocarboxylate transporter 2-like [Onthophagus taurus]